MAVRKRLFHPEEVRQKIRTSQLVNRLHAFVKGEIEMTPHQVTAALGLIRKTMPDLTAIAHSGTLGIEKAEDLNDAVLAHIALRGSDRASEETGSPEELSEVH
jgi:hypothetical protein